MIPTANLNNKAKHWKKALVVFFDIEFSGNIRSEFGKDCSIFEIALSCKKEELFCMINPYLTKKNVQPTVHPKYKMVSKEEYSNTNAKPFPVVVKKVENFVKRLLKKHKKEWVCFISHNGFRSDKVVLEHEMHYHNLPPLPFFFFDSLLYLREVCPGLDSYSLENLYQHMFKTKYEGHNAKTDTKALVKVFNQIGKPLHGVLYTMGTIPWRNSRGIGFQLEQVLLYNGITDIVHLYKLSNGDLERTKHILKDILMYSFSDKLLENIYYWYKLAEVTVNRQLLQSHFPPLPSK